MFNFMVSQHQNFKFQMKPQVVSGSDHSLSKITSQNIFVSSDLNSDLDSFGVSYSPTQNKPHYLSLSPMDSASYKYRSSAVNLL